MWKLMVSASVATALSGVAVAGPSAEWSATLVINPQCASLCSLRDLGRAKVSVRPSSRAGDGGLVARVGVSGAEKEPGSPGGDALTLRLRLSLSVQGGACQDYVGPTLPVKAGRLSMTVTGQQLQPPFPPGRGIVHVCAAMLDDGGAPELGPVLVDGMVFANFQ